MDNWNDDWRDELKENDYNVWERLAECRNNLNDITKICKLMYKYNQGKSKKDCLDRTLEWICDWNNQDNLYPSDEDYVKLLETL